jgi:hypothetical protein
MAALPLPAGEAPYRGRKQLAIKCLWAAGVHLAAHPNPPLEPADLQRMCRGLHMEGPIPRSAFSVARRLAF